MDHQEGQYKVADLKSAEGRSRPVPVLFVVRELGLGGIERDVSYRFGFWVVVVGFVGARATYVITNWRDINSPLELEIRFTPLQGKLSDYHVCALLAPHLGNQGVGNTATLGDHKGVPLRVVREIHERAIGLAWQVQPPPTDDRAGAWRRTGVAVGRVPTAVPSAVPADMEAWAASTRQLDGRHPVAHAALHHAWFERIHPFVDGNGRVGRLVLNFMLIQHGYPPAVILAAKRPQYLRALETADGGNAGPITEVIARAVSGALSRFLIPNLAGHAKLVPLAALAADSRYAPAYLRQLAQSGRLRAVHEGRLWLSSRAWLNEYIASRDPRGGLPGRGR